jgi:hypothetical protein
MVSIEVNTIGRDGHAVVGLRGQLDLSDAATFEPAEVAHARRRPV